MDHYYYLVSYSDILKLLQVDMEYYSSNIIMQEVSYDFWWPSNNSSEQKERVAQ